MKRRRLLAPQKLLIANLERGTRLNSRLEFTQNNDFSPSNKRAKPYCSKNRNKSIFEFRGIRISNF